ncbi:MAG: FkbM family methyltransferase [Anaerolineales bacterium]|nr:FkbM family methyltransferase [Anaerolineales bacterium]
MQLKNQRFFLWFNKLVFPFFYLRHQGKSKVTIDAGDDARFNVRVNTSDILVIWEIWKAKVYDDPRFPIQPDDVVVDIGAHIGGFAVRAAKQAHRGKVFAYEASSKNFAMLSENRNLNNADNLHIHNVAISDHRGEMKFFMPGDNGALGSLMQEKDSPMEIVQSMTLADILSENRIERIDYLKLDVEGAEYDILLGCSDETLSKIQKIVLEYHEFTGHHHSHIDLVECLKSHGFQVTVEAGIFPQKILFGTGILKAWRI